MPTKQTNAAGAKMQAFASSPRIQRYMDVIADHLEKANVPVRRGRKRENNLSLIVSAAIKRWAEQISAGEQPQYDDALKRYLTEYLYLINIDPEAKPKGAYLNAEAIEQMDIIVAALRKIAPAYRRGSPIPYLASKGRLGPNYRLVVILAVVKMATEIRPPNVPPLLPAI